MHWVDGVISVLQVKYKEGFDKHLKGQRPRYNPLECLSFKHIQAAAALASQVRDPVLFCPIFISALQSPLPKDCVALP